MKTELSITYSRMNLLKTFIVRARLRNSGREQHALHIVRARRRSSGREQHALHIVRACRELLDSPAMRDRSKSKNGRFSASSNKRQLTAKFYKGFSFVKAS